MADATFYIPELITEGTDLVTRPSSEGDIAVAVSEIAAVTSDFQESIRNSLDALLAVSTAFSQSTNTYELEGSRTPNEPDLSTPVYTPTTHDVGIPDFQGEAPTLSTPTLSIGDPPAMDIAAPAITIPDAPDADIPTFSGTAPDISAPDLPDKPAYTLPAVPTLTDLSIPEPPTYDLADFDAEAPVMDISIPPSASFAWGESGYVSQLATQLDGILRADIANTNSTGIAAGVENDIYNRARSRQDTDKARAATEAATFFLSRGFTPPPAAVASAVEEAANHVSQVDTDLENDIGIQGANLAQAHTRFVQGAAVDWEGTLLRYHDEAQGRALAAAKLAIDIANEVYKVKIEGYQGQADVYAAMADAFNSRIRAELGKAEFYKAQVDGKRLSVEAQRAMIMAYTAQVDSIYAQAEVYRAEVSAAEISTAIDRIRTESYVSLVNAFKAEIEANTARYKLYSARIMGEESKIETYRALVDAFDAQVEAHTEKARVEIAQGRTLSESAKAKADIYTAQVRKYAADVKYYLGKAEIQVLDQRAGNTRYDADQREKENTMDYRGKVAITQANEKAARESVAARLQAAGIKMQAELNRIDAYTKAIETKSDARRAASRIARHSVSENWSESDSKSSTKAYSHSKSWNSTATTSWQQGTYHHFNRHV